MTTRSTGPPKRPTALPPERRERYLSSGRPSNRRMCHHRLLHGEELDHGTRDHRTTRTRTRSRCRWIKPRIWRISKTTCSWRPLALTFAVSLEFSQSCAAILLRRQGGLSQRDDEVRARDRRHGPGRLVFDGAPPEKRL